MTSTKFRRYWFRPLRSIATGLGAGTMLAWILYRASTPVAWLTVIGMIVAGLWIYAIQWRPTTPETVEALMAELCRCGHTRREHAVAIFSEPECLECACDWMLPPVVYGPWDSRFGALTRDHQDRIIYGDVCALGLLVLLLCAVL